MKDVENFCLYSETKDNCFISDWLMMGDLKVVIELPKS